MVIGMIFPVSYVPSEIVELTDVTVGEEVSMTIALFAPKELVAPGLASVKVALFNAVSFIVPEFKASELVAK